MARLTVVVLCLVQFVDVLGVTGATTAIPTIVAQLHAPESAAALIRAPTTSRPPNAVA